MKETPLIRAAHNGHLHVVRHLLEAGADVNATDLVRAVPVRPFVCTSLSLAWAPAAAAAPPPGRGVNGWLG